MSQFLSKLCRSRGILNGNVGPSSGGAFPIGDRRPEEDAQKDVAEHFGVTPRTIERIRSEPPVTEVEQAAARKARGVGRRPIPEGVKDRMPALMEDPGAPPLDVLRLLRAKGTDPLHVHDPGT